MGYREPPICPASVGIAGEQNGTDNASIELVDAVHPLPEPRRERVGESGHRGEKLPTPSSHGDAGVRRSKKSHL